MPEDQLYGDRSGDRLSTRKPKTERDVVLATFSLYPEDIEHLNQLVKDLKKSGHRGVNKSRIVRQALTAYRQKDYRPPR
tara:strand:+ start:238 stop:474 length:237 start_codon:yes stop_codon:yes gene_type:complete